VGGYNWALGGNFRLVWSILNKVHSVFRIVMIITASSIICEHGFLNKNKVKIDWSSLMKILDALLRVYVGSFELV